MKCGAVYEATDAGKVCFKRDVNGKIVDIYGYPNCVSAYIPLTVNA